MPILQQLPIDEITLAEFCRKWKIAKLELFGSFLRDDFGPDSDIDLLVTYDEGARWSLLDHVHIENELSDMTGRKIDLAIREAVEGDRSATRRNAILGSAVPIYVAP